MDPMPSAELDELYQKFPWLDSVAARQLTKSVQISRFNVDLLGVDLGYREHISFFNENYRDATDEFYSLLDEHGKELTRLNQTLYYWPETKSKWYLPWTWLSRRSDSPYYPNQEGVWDWSENSVDNHDDCLEDLIAQPNYQATTYIVHVKKDTESSMYDVVAYKHLMEMSIYDWMIQKRSQVQAVWDHADQQVSETWRQN